MGYLGEQLGEDEVGVHLPRNSGLRAFIPCHPHTDPLVDQFAVLILNEHVECASLRHRIGTLYSECVSHGASTSVYCRPLKPAQH